MSVATLPITEPPIVTITKPLTKKVKRRIIQSKYKKKNKDYVRFNGRLTKRSMKVLKMISEHEDLPVAAIVREILDQYALCNLNKLNMLEQTRKNNLPEINE